MDIKRPEPHIKLPPDAKLAFKGQIFEVYQWEQKLFDGKTATFERLKRPDTVSVFPILPDGRILLISQQQPGRTDPYVSLPGGRVDEGEEAFMAIQRELIEETGYAGREWKLWDAYQPVHKIDWALYTFVAKNLKKVAEPHLDGGEKIELIPVTFEEMLDIAGKKDLVGGGALAAISEARADSVKKEELRKMFAV